MPRRARGTSARIYFLYRSVLAGEKVSVRQIRGEKELPPIATDDSYDFNYQEYREFQEPRKILPVSSSPVPFARGRQKDHFVLSPNPYR